MPKTPANMRPSALEMAIIDHMLHDRTLFGQGLVPTRLNVDFDSVNVAGRNCSAGGFMTEFEQSEQLRLFDAGVELRWGNVGARLGDSRIDSGYVVYVDGGYVTAIEGFPYGDDEWPSRVDEFELYDAGPFQSDFRKNLVLK